MRLHRRQVLKVQTHGKIAKSKANSHQEITTEREPGVKLPAK